MFVISLLFQIKRICLFINSKFCENPGHFHFALYAYFLGLVFSFFIPQISFDSISNEENQCSNIDFMDLCQSSAAR